MAFSLAPVNVFILLELLLLLDRYPPLYEDRPLPLPPLRLLLPEFTLDDMVSQP